MLKLRKFQKIFRVHKEYRLILYNKTRKKDIEIRSVECSDSEKNMSAYADQNHAPSLT